MTDPADFGFGGTSAGGLGWVVRRHEELYGQEYGRDLEFGACALKAWNLDLTSGR